MNEIDIDVIYSTPDGRLCAASFIRGNGVDIDDHGRVKVGYLVDGKLMSCEETEWAWYWPDDLTPVEKMNGIELAPVVDIATKRRGQNAPDA